MERRLTSLYENPKNSNNWYVDFAYYERDEWGGLRWTGDSEDCTFTEDELYELLYPRMEKHHTKIR